MVEVHLALKLGTNPASGHSGTWTRDLQISSPAPWPLGHAASLLHEVKLGQMQETY